MQSVVQVLDPAEDISLISVRDAKLGMNLFSVSSQSTDDQLEMLIKWSSDEIAKICNRVFAKERVKETLVEFNTDCPRLPLSHFPIRVDDSNTMVVTEDGTELVADVDYIIDVGAGVITKLDGG